MLWLSWVRECACMGRWGSRVLFVLRGPRNSDYVYLRPRSPPTHSSIESANASRLRSTMGRVGHLGRMSTQRERYPLVQICPEHVLSDHDRDGGAPPLSVVTAVGFYKHLSEGANER